MENPRPKKRGARKRPFFTWPYRWPYNAYAQPFESTANAAFKVALGRIARLTFAMSGW